MGKQGSETVAIHLFTRLGGRKPRQDTWHGCTPLHVLLVPQSPKQAHARGTRRGPTFPRSPPPAVLVPHPPLEGTAPCSDHPSHTRRLLEPLPIRKKQEGLPGPQKRSHKPRHPFLPRRTPLAGTSASPCRRTLSESLALWSLLGPATLTPQEVTSSSFPSGHPGTWWGSFWGPCCLPPLALWSDAQLGGRPGLTRILQTGEA